MTDRLALLRPAQRFLTGPRQRRRLQRQRAEMASVVNEFVRAGDLVFDVGAHAGEMTALFLEAGARVVAVEPQPDLAAQLRDRFSGQHVDVVDQGLAERPGTREMSISRESTLSSMEPEWQSLTGSSGRFGGATWESKIRVEVTTVDALAERFGAPAFVKIDVEGFEEQVLMGLSSPIPALCFEFVAERPAATAACVARLHDLGISEFNFSDGHSGPELVANQWLSAPELLDRIGALRNPLATGDIYARVPKVA